MKQAQLAKATDDINPNLIEVSERVPRKEKPKEPIPDTEWWYVIFLTLPFLLMLSCFVSDLTFTWHKLGGNKSSYTYQTNLVTFGVFDESDESP